MKNSIKWLSELNNKGFFNDEENDSFYYCNPFIEYDSKTNRLSFSIVPYFMGDDEDGFINRMNISRTEFEKISNELEEVCSFDLTKDNIPNIIEHLYALGWMDEECNGDIDNWLNSVVNYDFSNYDFSTFPTLPAYCEGYLTIDGEDIF